MAATDKSEDKSRGDTGVHMRPSRVLRKLREGGIASCIKLNLLDPRGVEVVAMSGIDSIWLDTEHVPTNYADLEDQVRAAKVYDVDTIVRVPRGSYSDYIRGLEMDAAGIMAPHVMNLEDARNIVRMTKFPPLGKRAVDGGNADGAYCRVDFLEYLETANRERFVIYQIEDPEALPDLEAIAALPGVDMLLFGAGDFSVTVGKPGQTDDPEIAEVRARVARVARQAGKAAGVPAAPHRLKEMVDLGYNFICAGADVIALAEYADNIAAAFANL